MSDVADAETKHLFVRVTRQSNSEEIRMNPNHTNFDQFDKATPFWKSGVGVALIMLALVVTFYLIREHWAHLGQRWPYLLLLLCPLMHLFMHGGHGHGGSNTPPKNLIKKDDNSIS